MEYRLRFLFVFICLMFLFDSTAQEKDSLSYYKSLSERSSATEDLLKAYVYFDNSMKRNIEGSSFVNAVHDLDYLSMIERKVGQLYESEKSGVKALKLLDGLPKDTYNLYLRKRVINRLGIIRRNLKDYNKATEYYKNLLNLENTSSNEATIYNNIGITFKYQGQLDSARYYLEKAYLIGNSTDARRLNYARTLDNFGFVQALLNENEGMNKMMKALEIRDSLNSFKFTSYVHLAEVYTIHKNKKRALFYLNKAYDEATKNDYETGLLEVLKSLLKLDQSEFLEEFLKLNDRVKLERQLNENKFAKVKYDLGKSERKLADEKSARLNSEKKSQRNLFILVVTILISSFLLYLVRLRHKKQLLIKQFETENRISKKLHDEVANDVFHLMTKYQADEKLEKVIIDELEDIYQKVRDVSKANTDVDVSNNFELVIQDLFSNYISENTNIITKGLSVIIWDDVDVMKRKVLFRVIQELLINMKKHSKATLVSFNFQTATNNIIIDYMDNGLGCDLVKSNGLLNTESRMEMIGGQITFDSKIDNGFKATLIL